MKPPQFEDHTPYSWLVSLNFNLIIPRQAVRSVCQIPDPRRVIFFFAVRFPDIRSTAEVEDIIFNAPGFSGVIRMRRIDFRRHNLSGTVGTDRHDMTVDVANHPVPAMVRGRALPRQIDRNGEHQIVPCVGAID